MTKRKDLKDHKPDGRPTKYLVSMNEQAFKLCLLGAIDKELADFFHVTESTLNSWKIGHPKFLESLKAGREEADANVGSRLYQRALGYEHPDIHFSSYEGEVTQTRYTKVYPPDPTSCIFWLKNRRRQDWRDVDTRGALTPVTVDDASLLELARQVAFLIRLGSTIQEQQEQQEQPASRH